MRPRAAPASIVGMPDADLVVSPALTIPAAELRWRASRSGGPGGQHVNTSSTRVELLWDVAGSAALSDAQRARLLSRLAGRLDSAGVLRVVAQDERSQRRNRDAALERLAALVAAGLHVPKARRKTRPTAASKARRLDTKRRRGAVKRERRRPPADD